MTPGQNEKLTKASSKKVKNTKGEEISLTRLISCYVVSLAIVGLCIYEYLRETAAGESGVLYIILAVMGIGLSVFITLTNRKNRNSKGRNKK